MTIWDVDARARKLTLSIALGPNCMQEPNIQILGSMASGLLLWVLLTQVAMPLFGQSSFIALPQSYAIYLASFATIEYFLLMSGNFPSTNPTNSLAFLNDRISHSLTPTHIYFSQNSRSTMFPTSLHSTFLIPSRSNNSSSCQCISSIPQ